MSKYARTKPGSDQLYYLPDFAVIYVGDTPTLVYKPLQIKMQPVSIDEIDEVENSYNDEHRWIPVDHQHLDQVKRAYKSEQPESHSDFFAAMRKELALAPYDDTRARKTFVSFESFYQLAAKAKSAMS